MFRDRTYVFFIIREHMFVCLEIEHMFFYLEIEHMFVYLEVEYLVNLRDPWLPRG